MKNTQKIAAVVILASVVAIVLAIKREGREAGVSEPASPNSVASIEPEAEKALPRLVDLGADKCIPCKMMAPILDELKNTQSDRLTVEFIDVWKNPDAGQQYGIRVIPTQIFYAKDGTELFRHEGFFSKEDIVAKWKEFGIDLPAETSL